MARGIAGRAAAADSAAAAWSPTLPRPLYLEKPDLDALETEVLDARPGALLVARSPFFPGGGGQLADRGTLSWAGGELLLVGTRVDAGGVWLEDDGGEVAPQRVLLRLDRAFRALMCELHTIAHIVNAIVYRHFGGALLTGAQLSADATLRVDFDLPDADNERLRRLDGAINAALREDLAVTAFDMPWQAAAAIPGMFRSKAVSPPMQADGSVRIVEIRGLDRQASGGTHLAATGMARPVGILKVESKGRHNRRVRVGLLGAA
jgi:misacylated tRNA(Ala) deacylase